MWDFGCISPTAYAWFDCVGLSRTIQTAYYVKQVCKLLQRKWYALSTYQCAENIIMDDYFKGVWHSVWINLYAWDYMSCEWIGLNVTKNLHQQSTSYNPPYHYHKRFHEHFIVLSTCDKLRKTCLRLFVIIKHRSIMTLWKKNFHVGW